MLERTWVHRTGSRCVAILAFTVVLTAITVGGGHAIAQTFSSGSTGADGAFNPTTNTTLALPPNGVFNFTTINIPAGVTVTFTRNTTNTPVTMLASGNVVIAGTINLDGAPGGNASTATSIASNWGLGGPGGFDGGDGADGIASTTGGAGLGPGREVAEEVGRHKNMKVPAIRVLRYSFRALQHEESTIMKRRNSDAGLQA